MEAIDRIMNRGTGFFWLLTALLFGGAAYFAFHVLRMKAEQAGGGAESAEAAAPSPGSSGGVQP